MLADFVITLVKMQQPFFLTFITVQSLYIENETTIFTRKKKTCSILNSVGNLGVSHFVEF